MSTLRRLCLAVVLAAGCAGDSGKPSLLVPDAAGPDANSGRAAHDAGATGSDAGAAAESVCCTTSTGPGCADHAVEQCVCNQVPSCCEQPWDIVCVQLADSLNCTACKADCCAASPTKGCNQ